jgi:hypothetical protein
MKKQLLYLFFLLFLIMAGLYSCKLYTFSGAALSPDVKSVSIKTFSNQASIVVPSLSEKITEKLRDKFLKEMNLKLVEDNGDITFKGSVIDYRVTPSSITSNEQSQTSRLTISVRVKFENIKEPKLNYETVFSSYMDFDATKDLSMVENDLIEGITNILVQDIFNKAVNNW